MKEELKGFAHSEDEELETRLHDWVWDNRHTHPNLTLGGGQAGADQGYVYYNGLPLCAYDKTGRLVWSKEDANVVCKMLGFSAATAFPYDSCYFGPCPLVGFSFGMSGFKCDGSETDILDCPHDDSAALLCGSNGVTDGGHGIVGAICF